MRADIEQMKTKEEVEQLLFERWKPVLCTERIPVDQAARRVLAENLYAKYDIPVVRASMMDGIAVKSDRFEHGTPDTTEWVEGTDYVRADTGDDFSDDFDAVIAIENVTFAENGGISLPENVNGRKGFNVKEKGTDVQCGSIVGKKGTTLLPQDLAALVMGGYGKVPVYRKPVVAFLATGSELVDAGENLMRGQNFDSNSIMVSAMLEGMGAECLLHKKVADQAEDIERAIYEMVEDADIILVNAGTSKGSEDYCARILEEKGDMLFHGVRAVPGRPMSITMLNDKPVINMSGPAFAAFYSCDWIVKKMIAAMYGIQVEQREQVEAILTERFATPPFFSAMSAFSLTIGENQQFYATPIALRGPQAGKNCGIRIMQADAYYITTPGERVHEKGETIVLELAR